ncbi:hypothetical protein Tco_0974841 [Tanacetum coccineum]|uniref:Uncharacterized protein n=1 Tax=Tanacetum coccineum TaxID=301880 RepID=A0ABQ5ECQ6_9ASTR
MLYQNYLREFWCTAVVEDPNPPEDDSKGLIITKATKFLIPPLRNLPNALVTPLPNFKKKGKKKSQTVSQPKPKTHGPEASGALY